MSNTPTKKSFKVTDDLLERLNSQLPAYPQPSPASEGTLASMNERFGKLEEMYEKVTQELNDKIKNLEDIISAGEPEATAQDTSIDREAVTAELRAIVDSFNKALENWYKTHGCVVSFNWNYTGFKSLEITSIDHIVYRKAAPKEETLKDLLTTRDL